MSESGKFDKYGALIERFKELLAHHDSVPFDAPRETTDRGYLPVPFAPARWGELRALVAALSAERRINLKSLIHRLEGSAPNTDTCWQWRAATALRQHPQWETAEIEL